MNGRCVGTGDLLAVAQADVYPPHPHPVYCSVPSVGRGLLWIKAKQAFSYLIRWYHSSHNHFLTQVPAKIELEFCV